MSEARALRILVRATTRTDLPCIGCGGFRTELAVVVLGEGEAHCGLHERCVGKVQQPARQVAHNHTGR